MRLKWKIVIGAVAALVLAALIAWAVDAVRSRQEAERLYAWEEQGRLWKQAQAAQEASRRLSAEVAALRVRHDMVYPLKPTAERKAKVAATHPEAGDQARDYLTGHGRAVDWTNPSGSIRIRIPESLSGDSVDVDLDLKTLCSPYIENCGSTPGSTTKSTLKSPVRRGTILEVGAGYGIAGIDSWVESWPLRVGSDHFYVSPGIYARGTWRPSGTLDGNVGAGVKLSWE
jgi:hypothetical protein